MVEGILVLTAVILGWILRGFKIGQLREIKKQVKKKFTENKSRVVEWTPPKSEEEQAEEEVRDKLKK